MRALRIISAVLLLGTTKLAWRRFLTPVVSINFVIALGYSALGDWAYLPVALVVMSNALTHT